MIHLNNNRIPKIKNQQQIKRRKSAKPKRRTRRKGAKGGVDIVTRTAPVAKNYLVRRMVPTKKSSGNNYTVSSEDYYDDLDLNPGLNLTTIQLNPGLSTFPWLSQQAAGYDKYRIKRFTVTYVPKNAVTTTAGTIYGAYDYDCDDAPPADIKTIMSYQSSRSGCLYNKLVFEYNPRCANEGMTWRRVRSAPTARERYLYDPANFHLLVDVPTGTVAAGQLIFHYTVEFSCPGLASSIEPRIPSTIATFRGEEKQQTGGAILSPFMVADHAAAFCRVAAPPYGYRIAIDPGVYRVAFRTYIIISKTTIAGGEYLFDSDVVMEKSALQVNESGNVAVPHSASHYKIEVELSAIENYFWGISHNINTILVVTEPGSHYIFQGRTVGSGATPTMEYAEAEMYTSLNIELLS